MREDIVGSCVDMCGVCERCKSCASRSIAILCDANLSLVSDNRIDLAWSDAWIVIRCVMMSLHSALGNTCSRSPQEKEADRI